jgi:hypothetical protein
VWHHGPTSHTSYRDSSHLIGAGHCVPGPMSSECSTAAVPAGGSGRTKTGLCSSTAGASPPENSGTPHGAPGTKPWWKANAGVAITASISAEINAAAKNLLTLLKVNLLRSLPLRRYMRKVVFDRLTPPRAK